MFPPHLQRRLLVILTALMALNRTSADSVLLKDGSEISGEIVSDGDVAVVVEYAVTPTIKDQKTIPRDQIVKLTKLTKDEKAFLSMGSRATPSTVLDTSFYDPLIDKKLPEFLGQFPYSKHISEVREDFRSMTAERERVKRGDRRIDGVWFTSEQIAADPYQTGAKVRFYEISHLVPKDDPASVLKAYEVFEKAFPGCGAMPDTLDLACNQLTLLQGKISSAKANFGFLEKQRQMNIATLRADEAKEVQNAMDKDNLVAKAAIANAAKDGSKFFPIFPNNKEALDALQVILTSEKARLALLQAIPMRESLTASQNAAKLIQQEKYKLAQDQLVTAAKLWPENAAIATLRKKIEDLTNPVKTSPVPAVPPRSSIP